MRVAIVSARIAGVRGGAEELADELAEQLRRRGHEAELVGVPFDWRPARRILDSLRAAQQLQLEQADRVVALKFPAWAVPHPDKVVWMLHQHRGAYDRPAIRDTAIRDEIRHADERAFAEARRVLAISEVVAGRAERFNGVRPEVLRPPLPKADLYRAGEYGEYVF